MKVSAKKVFCIIGMIVGIIFTIKGIILCFTDPYTYDSMFNRHPLEYVNFGSDYNTDSYHAFYFIENNTRDIENNTRDIVKALGNVLTLLGIFSICFFGMCFFGIKNKEITVNHKQ